MPNAKKKGGKKAIKAESQALRENADAFRSLLLSARSDYSKGRSYDAVETQKRALEFGSSKLPRFDDNSLVKAHALVELGLALSAIMTDFAHGEEWRKVRVELEEAFLQAMEIFENRLVPGKTVIFRKDECWMEIGKYQSPVPHTERLGPIDYVTSAQMAVGGKDPTKKTVESLRRAITFGKFFYESKCTIRVDDRGFCLQGDMPSNIIDSLSAILKEHEAILAGRSTKEESTARLYPDERPDVRHSGTRLGEMKLSHEKLAKDIEKKGLRPCSNVDCGKVEKQPRQFSACSRCKWAAYCSRECQTVDWKRHKKECKTEAAQKRSQYEEQNKDGSTLKYGQSQQLLLMVRFFHHFAATSKEMKSTETIDAMMVKSVVLPQIGNEELGTLQLGMQSVGIMWKAIWSMKEDSRNALIQGFLRKIEEYNFPPKSKGGPDFSIISKWGSVAIAGNFAVVKHTPDGTILLHSGGSEDRVKAFLVKGITQSLETILEPMDMPLPLYICTAIFPYKDMIVCQGTITPLDDYFAESFERAAVDYTKGKLQIDVLTSLE